MTRFDSLAGRLPTPWRPDDDDSGVVLRLTPADVLAVEGDRGILPSSVVPSGVGVLVSLPRRTAVRRVRLAPHVGAGPGHLLQLRAVRQGHTPVTPTAVAAVGAGLAVVDSSFRVDRFTAALVRRPLVGVALSAVADVLDRIAEDAATVQQAHWLATADSAVTAPYVQRLRTVQRLPPLRPADPADIAEVEAFAAIDALGRLAGLLDVAPYETPPSVRETVEAFRRRVRRIVGLYRGGLGTLGAVARMVEASLPELPGTAATRDRPFTVEEHAPVLARGDAVTAGPPEGLVGPLMRWAVTSHGVGPASPTLVVVGSDPDAGEVDATTDPVVQLFTVGDRPVGLGLAWAGTVPSGRALRVRPTAASWLGGEAGVRVASRSPTDGAVARVDPTAPGPWAAAGSGPPGTVTALAQVADASLWAGVDDGTAGALWRFDGSDWTQEATGLAPVRALAAAGGHLLVGTTAGLLVGTLHPAAGGVLALDGDPGPAVHGIAAVAADDWLLATDAGVRRAAPDNLVGTAVGPVTAGGDEPDVRAVYIDRHHVRWLGCDRGLLVHQPGLDHWYAYLGSAVDESVPDWVRLPPGDGGRPVLPDPSAVHLPTVHALAKTADETLWLGTDRGLARYLARPLSAGSTSSTTVLEAFPDLGDAPVRTLAIDPRGGLWIGGDRGLFRFRGRDLEQHGPDGWVLLGRAVTLADGRPRGEWRFDPSTAGWQRWSATAGRRFLPTTLPPRGSDEPPVHAVTWTTGAVADLLDGLTEDGSFTSAAPVDPATLGVRWQPEPTRVVDGGIPSVPAVPPGTSVWRYLRREAATDVEPERRPAWTAEGRLLPPPPDQPAAGEARFDRDQPPPPRVFDETVFAFPPAARVQLSWPSPRPLSLLVRLDRLRPGETLDPVVLDRVWAGIQKVRPAGVAARLAVEDDVVRGAD